MTQSASSSTPDSYEETGVVASAPRQRTRFPKAARVRRKAEFARVFEAGRRKAEPDLALHWLEDDGPARLGLAVSRKVDPRAVRRNRIKRILREAFRQLRPRLLPGAYVIVARRGAAHADATTLRAAIERLLRRIGALPALDRLGTMPAATSSHLPLDPAAPARGPDTADE
ncbi:ribonuclease P protein component [Thermomonas alba]|uniref:ribonuclease P protein component n=1 Tax=Thermomonas alba TaxID=2888525 RepID=UPI0023D966E5|nr:ribonuclease P protein component [Thermomonas alba]